MDGRTFVNLAKRRFDHCAAILEGKNAEYSRGGDKLHNFKRAARLMNQTPEAALVGMWAKHLISILDLVDDLPDLPSVGVLYEKMTDAINYLVLLEALFMERIDGDGPDIEDMPISSGLPGHEAEEIILNQAEEYKRQREEWKHLSGNCI